MQLAHRSTHACAAALRGRAAAAAHQRTHAHVHAPPQHTHLGHQLRLLHQRACVHAPLLQHLRAPSSMETLCCFNFIAYLYCY